MPIQISDVLKGQIYAALIEEGGRIASNDITGYRDWKKLCYAMEVLIGPPKPLKEIDDPFWRGENGNPPADDLRNQDIAKAIEIGVSYLKGRTIPSPQSTEKPRKR